MSSAVAAAAAGAGAPSGADDRVYRAVAAGGSAEDVRRAIERSRSSAAVNQTGRDGETPLAAARRMRRRDLVCLLLENGAEAAGDDDWFKAIKWCVRRGDLAGFRRLIERGASVNTSDRYGYTPLILACCWRSETPDRRDLTLEIFRRSSLETRRAVCGGWSAVDNVFVAHEGLPLAPWRLQLIGELLAAGAPVVPLYRARVLPIAAAHAARREAELAACQSMAHDWRAHETFVGLSLDVRELREAEQMVAARRARLAALERELGNGTSSGSGSDESDSESESDEDDEAAGSGGGGGGEGES